MLKSTIALLAGVLFVSATNAFTEEEENYRRTFESEHIDGTIKYISDRCKKLTGKYDKLFQDAANNWSSIIKNTTDKMKAAAIQIRSDMTTLQEKQLTNNDKCKKYITDVKNKRKEATNNLNTCITNDLQEAIGAFDHLKLMNAKKSLRDMETIREMLNICVNNSKSYGGDIYHCEYHMKWSIIVLRSTFDTTVSLSILAAEYFHKRTDRTINYCIYYYGENNFSEITKTIVEDFNDCLKTVEQGTPVPKLPNV